MLKTDRGVSNHGRCFGEEGIKDSRRSQERSGPCLEGSALGGEELGGPGRGIGTGGGSARPGEQSSWEQSPFRAAGRPDV